QGSRRGDADRADAQEAEAAQAPVGGRAALVKENQDTGRREADGEGTESREDPDRLPPAQRRWREPRRRLRCGWTPPARPAGSCHRRSPAMAPSRAIRSAIGGCVLNIR